MAETTTSIRFKNVPKEKFSKWFGNLFNGLYTCDNSEWELGAYMEEGNGGHFWEGIAVVMVAGFPGIVFKGENNLIWDDHILHTRFQCDGKELTLSRSVELPCDCEDLDEDELAEYEVERAWFEADYDIPYLKKFTVDEIATYHVICKESPDVPGEELDNFIKAKCTENNMSFAKYTEISSIIVYTK